MDAIIIGAGPAGCVAAILLTRAAWRITLIEQHRFPRDKVCGECLSALGIDVLDRIGLTSSLKRLHPITLAKAALVSPDGGEATLRLPRPMWGLSRAALDQALLDEARACGAIVMQPARCESIDEPDVTVTVRNLSTNQLSTLSSRYILIADGKAARGVAERETRSRDFGLKAHFAGIEHPRDTISLFGLTGHYVGVAPIEGDRWNVAMSVPASRIRAFAGDFEALFNQCLRENRGLSRRFHSAQRTTPWLASPLPRFPVARTWPPRIIPLGNSAAALEPLGGEGMGLAMRSAELAATSLASSRDHDRDAQIAALSRQFSKLWRTRSLTTRAAALLLSHRNLACVATRFAHPLALPLVGK